jgi:hypothetical protein
MRPSGEYRESGSGDPQILIVVDNPEIHPALDGFLNSRGFRVTTVPVEAGVNGAAIMRAARGVDPRTDVVVITGCSSLKAALEQVGRGDFDRLAGGFELIGIETIVNRNIERQRPGAANRRVGRLSLLAKRSESAGDRLGAIEARFSTLVASFDCRGKALTALTGC